MSDNPSCLDLPRELLNNPPFVWLDTPPPKEALASLERLRHAYLRCQACMYERVNETLRRHGIKKCLPVEGTMGDNPNLACEALVKALDQIEPFVSHVYRAVPHVSRYDCCWVLPAFGQDSSGAEHLYGYSPEDPKVCLRATDLFSGVAVEFQKVERLKPWTVKLERGSALVLAWLDRLKAAAEEPGREPNREWCLPHPYAMRWKDTVTAAPRLWHLFGYMLDHQDQHVSFEEARENVFGGTTKSKADKSIINDVSALNDLLLNIQFPWNLSVRGGIHFKRPT